MSKMYEQLKGVVADQLRRGRSLKPQTERQLNQVLSESGLDIATFLVQAAELLEDHELDILFAPHFTPTLADQAEVSPPMYHWRPTDEQVDQLVRDLVESVSHAVVRLPDGHEAALALHEVMVERFVRLLKLHQAPAACTVAALRDALPSELWPVVAALIRGRGFDPPRQAWFARFVHHMTSRHSVEQGLLVTAAEFVSAQATLEPSELLAAAQQAVTAAHGTVAYARGGHAYWSPDVAQHHNFRGQGQVDESRIKQRQDEADWLETIALDLSCYKDDGE